MSDVNANINVNVDTSNALSQIKALQRQLSEFYTSISRSSATAALAQRDLQSNLVNTINSLGGFSAEMRTIKTSAESFTSSLEKNKFSMREYFRYAGASTKTFGSLFKSEFDTINKVAEDNVKRLQTQYIKLGRDSSGAMKAIAVMPTQLNMEDLSVKTQMAAQKQALFNQLVKQGSTNLLNFGKNTQWAGRQLMVGFTVPLTILGNTAAKAFMDMESAALKFRKVYGDLFTPAEETQQALDSVNALAASFTKYGIAASSTVSLAADAAAAGFQGLDLQRQVTEATRLQVLGQVDQQKALETTISLQNAFQMSSEDLSGAIDFLNAVENQTVLSLDDVTTAIPKAAPVVKQLGGNVKDLAFFMAAMKEGGINASEGANALKSGLASLINPTTKAKEMMAGFGINIDQIVNKNAGNVKQTVIEFAQALDNLSDLDRQRAIEQLFGKFQLARLSTLFENVTKTGNQASRVLDLATASTADLAAISEKELGMTADSAMNKFRKSVEDLKLALVPVGQIFLETVRPILDFIGKALDKFDGLSSGTKKAITIITVAIGAIGPIALMTFGLLANALANGIKFISILRNGYLKLTGQSKILGEQTDFLTVQQQEAAAVAHSLDQSHARLTQTFNAEKTAVSQLASAYTTAARAASALLINNPGMILPGRTPKKFAEGGFITGSGTGTSDSIPAMVSNGESIIPARQTKKYNGLISKILADKVPGYAKGLFKSVDVPGSADAAHFGGSRSMTGKEILALLGDLETATARNIKKMIGTTEAQLNKTFTVFDNSVINQLTSVNREFSQKGKVSTATARSSVLDSGFAETRDSQLQNQLTKSGMSIKDFNEVNKKITERITAGFDELGDQVEITSDNFDKLIRKAYEEVAKTDKRVAKAYAEMKQVTTVYNPTASPTRGARQAITDSSYVKEREKGTYVQGRQQVGVADPYPEIGRFGIRKAAADQVGISLPDMSKVYAQMSDQAKIALSKLKNDTQAFALEFERQATQAGLKIGNAYKTGIDKSGLNDIYVESRHRQSPHPLAPRDGADDGRAYESARQNEIKKRRVASSPGGTVGPGGVIIPMMPPVGGGSDSDGVMFGPSKPTRFDKTFGTAAGRLRNVSTKFGSGKYAGAGFAASMAVSAGSMMPGPVGDLSQKAMPAVFGLQALQMALKLPIPHLKAVAAVALLAYGAFKLFNSIREKERLAIEGLGDAATLTAQKVKTLGEFFGVTPTQTKLERTGPSLILNNEKRSQVDQLRGTDSFKKDFGKDIKSLKGATDSQAKLIFNSLAIQLKGKGFAKENIDTIIKALQEESSKTNFKFDFAKIELATEKGRATLERSAVSLGNSFGKQFSEGYSSVTTSYMNRVTGEVVNYTQETLSKGLKKSIATTSKAIAGMFNGLSGQIENGSITAEQFNQSFEGISKTIEGMPEPQGMFLLNNILKNMPGDLAKTAVGIKNMSDQLLIAKAAMLGVSTITPEMVKQLKAASESNDSGAARAANRVRAKIKSDVKAIKELFDIVKKEMTDIEGGGSSGGGEDSIFTKLKKQLQETINNARYSAIAFNKMRAAGIGVAEALELSKDPLLAQVLATEKSKTNIATILKLVKKMNTELQKEALSEFLKGLQASSKLKKDFLELIPTLEKLGLTSEEITAILDKPDVANGLIKGFNKAQDKAAYLKQYIDQIVQDRVMNIKINISTTGGKAQAISTAAEGAIKVLDARALLIRQAAEKGNYGGNLSAMTGITAEQQSRLSKINLSASKQAVDTAKANVTTQQNVIAGINNTINAKQRLIDLNSQLISQQQIEIDNIDKAIEAQQMLVAGKEKYVETTFDKPLQALQDESNILSNSLSQIEHQQQAINAEYDKQQTAMEALNKLNQDSIEQGKTKISIADALSQGDISAAAQAVQDLRVQEAAASAASVQSMFDASRQGALNNVNVNGMNKAQIEERQYQIQQQSFKLEQDKALYIKINILPLQEQIKKLEADKIPIQNEINRITSSNEGIQREIEGIQTNQLFNAEQTLTTLEGQVTAAENKLEADEKIVDEIIEQLKQSGLTKKEWEEIGLKADAAKTIFESITSTTEAAAAAAKEIADTFNALAANPPYFTSYEDHFITNYITNVVTTVGDGSSSSSGSTGGGGGGGGFMEMKTFGGKIRKYAIGGSVVPGEGLLDSVKALLTPGEFVVNKASAKAYGPLLEAINNQVYPSMNLGTSQTNNNTPQPKTQISMPSFSKMQTKQNPSSLSNVQVSQNQVDNSSAVYNYDVSINVSGNNMDSESVANNVLVKIKNLQDQQIRRRLK